MKRRAGPAATGTLLLAAVLIAAVALSCGCGSMKATRNSTPSTAPGDTPAGSQEATAPASTGSSESEAAIDRAKAEGKPVLVKFGSGQCIPCRQIEANISKIRPEYEGRVAFVIVDVYDPNEQNLANRYGIQTIPTTYFLDKDGAVVNKVVGVMEPDQLKQQLDSML